ncbi:hypothetical protein HNR42_002575 [Deinobacterium chartae]|uniref:Uncharacterized protein n=1 Tax=Deinobacterium chartae TaxID=521158 RepID=A0A841I4B2_9DEIO|nr:hypothetical protein [Deinobacterium chartae]MBB6099139.1 hypothetical protein [Deinobacterium chartae]
MIFLTLLLGALSLAAVPLSIAAFAGLNTAAPDLLRLLGALEATLAGRVGLAGLEPFWRGLLYMGASALLMALSVWSKPRRRR